MITRRSFIGRAAALAALGPLSGLPAVAGRRVAVIGAGGAGLAAARTLGAAGVEVRLLEARLRIGGRAWTDTDTLGVAVDRGCSWLHSSAVNPLVAVAQQLEIPTFVDEQRLQLRDRKGPLDEATHRELRALAERAWAELEMAGERGLDIPASSALSAQTKNDPLFPIVAAGMRSWEGVELEHYSTLDSYHFVEKGPDLVVPTGLGALLRRWSGNQAVELGTAVRRVDWSGSGVRLDTNRGVIRADAVVVTVPTTILQRASLVFAPELPIGTLQAIHDLPLGLMEKVGLLLAEGTLPTRADETVMLAMAAPEAFTFRTRLWGSNAVLGYTSGTYAHALVTEGEQALLAAATEQLVALFGADLRGHIERSMATRWAVDSWSLGAYSHCVPGRFGARARLTEPVGERIFFAGEHTEQSAYGTLHGAWSSGQRAAAQVLASMGVTQHAA